MLDEKLQKIYSINPHIMIELIWNITLLVANLFVLSHIVENYFIPALEYMADRLNMSSDIAGATLMALGSSAPELFISIMAITQVGEAKAVGAGTIVGSAIFNILVIIGASALYKKAKLTWQPVVRDLVFYIMCIVLLFFTFLDGRITLIESFAYIGLYIVYILAFKQWKKVFPYTIKEQMVEEIQTLEKGITHNLNKYLKMLTNIVFFKPKDGKKHVLNFLFSIIALVIISHMLVQTSVFTANFFNIPPVVIALTVLAAGTSIPDLLASIYVAKKGKGDMAIANAVGSNIFDIAIGLGLPWLVYILLNGTDVEVLSQNLVSSIALLFSTVVALLFLLIAKKWELSRYGGFFLILLYVLYISYQAGLVQEIESLSLLIH